MSGLPATANRNSKTRLILTIFFVLTMLTAAFAGKSGSVQAPTGTLTPTNRKLLAWLDSVLAEAPTYKAEKEQRLARLRSAYRSSTDENRRYWLASDLYEEYSAYDSDSALVYVDRAIEHGHRLGREDFITDMELNRSYILAATGMFEEAEKSLSRINPDSLNMGQALKYCDRWLFLLTHRDQYIGVAHDTGVYSAKMDSLLQKARKTITPDNPNYGWLIGWSSLSSKEEARKSIPVLENIVSKSDPGTRSYAMITWILAKLYEQVADRANMLRNLLLSSIADVKASNKEVASLEEVASMLYDLGDYGHANIYVTQCMAWATEYKSRVRLTRLSELREKTIAAVNEREAKQAGLIRIYLIVLIISLAVLLLAVVYILRTNRALHRSRVEISDANNRLKSKVNELEAIRNELHDTNAKLSESNETIRSTARELSEINSLKEEYIANVFSLCTSYIVKHDEFRSKLHKLLSERKFDELARKVKSPELSYGELKELYAEFDRVFLNIYPDFVHDSNSLLRPEEQIEQKAPDTLTTDLRVYALVRMGINDSNRIARFLHCSVQTVYNIRQRTRNKAVVPRDEFALRVRSLGKPVL